MSDINITVAHKVAVSDTQSIVCDNSDYMVHWTLDEEWSAYDTKTMRTIYMDGTFTDKVFSGAEVELPVCTVPGVVQIGLFAGDIRTSRVAILRALPSVRSAAGAPADPTPDVYDQLMELIKGLGGTDPDDIAKAVADYLAAHPIKETDPTVPEWAKAEKKPTYTAAEVGAVAQTDLQAATDAALAQAKASGAFDGATGPAGPAGPAGAPGKDGAGMDITGATVGQIAKIAAVDSDGVPTAWSPVDMPSGGGDEWVKVVEATLTEVANEIRLNFDPCKAIYIEFQYGAVENDLGLIGIYPNPKAPIYTGEDRAAAITQKTSDTNKRGYIFCAIDRQKGTPWMATSQIFHRGDGTFGSIEPGDLMNCEIRCFNDNTWASLINPMYLTSTDYINAVSAFGAGMNIGTTLTVWGVKA